MYEEGIHMVWTPSFRPVHADHQKIFCIYWSVTSGGPEEHERELTQLFPEFWVEDKPLSPPGWLNIKPQ